MTGPDSSYHADYAQEWIAFLKRRNFVLNIIWPLLLMLAIGTGIAAIYYFQSLQAERLAITLLADKHTQLQLDNKTLNEQLSQKTQENTQLQADVAALKSAREVLSVQQDDSVTKLTITSQMLENLEQQLALYKTENAELTEQLNAAKQALNEMESQHAQALEILNTEHEQQVSELNQQIEARKTAYQALASRQQEMRSEIDRFSTALTSKEQALEKLNNEKQQLSGQLKETQTALQMKQADYGNLQRSYSELETKLNALVTPIAASPAKTTGIKSSEKLNNQDLKFDNITGFEEIKKPKTPPPAKQDPLDYEQIKVLP